MIILRNKEFSRPVNLPKSRIGVGWAQDKNGKTESEDYFRAGQKAADEAYAKGKSDKDVVKSAKRAASTKVITRNLEEPIERAVKVGGMAYLGSKFGKDVIGYLQKTGQLKYNPITAKLNVLAPKLSRHAGKIGLGAAALAASTSMPKILKKRKSAVMGVEINTNRRLDKANNNNNNDNTKKK